MAEVVLVHGIGPVEETGEQLRHEWLQRLVHSMRATGHAPGADLLEQGSVTVSMAYYRDLFTPYVPKDDWDVPFPDSMADDCEQIGESLIDNISRYASDPEDRADAERELEELHSELGPEQGPYAPVRMVVTSLGRLGPIARSGFAGLCRIGVWNLGQVAAYLNDESVREGAIEAVLSRVTADTRAVVAHSLGTVVAYEALHRIGQPLPLLITFGSPLGLRSVVRKRLRPHPLEAPPLLERWVDVADRDDYIVGTLRLQKYFPDGQQVLGRTRRVRNANHDPHAALQYLRHHEVVAPLVEALGR